MTLNLKVSLIGLICIFIAGGLGSYKSFQLHEELELKNHQAKSQEISQWVAESVEQKIIQLESSVSYLDRSTVETLKRMGARYFVYAFKKSDEWSLKWKVLGEFGEEQILKEVNQIDFDKLSVSQRSWTHADKKRLIYVAPVELAQSHQLKTGFLIFGLDSRFFDFLNSADRNLVLVNKNQQAVYKKLPASLKANKELFNETGLASSIQMPSEARQANLAAGYFSPLSQLWVIKLDRREAANFLTSPFLFYFLLASLLVSMLFMALVTRAEKPFTAVKAMKLRMPNFRGWLPEKSVPQDSSFAIGDDSPEVVSDFSDFIDSVLVDEYDRLNKVGVSVKTLIEENAELVCSPQHVADLIRRLIGNSVLTLEDESEKEIQIQLVEQSQAYQLIYVDTRTKSFPSGHEPSLLLQTDGSMVGIDGIIAYASWHFGDALTVAKKGFCLSIDLKKVSAENQLSKSSVVDKPVVVEATPLVDSLERIEITDEELDDELFESFSTLNSWSDLKLKSAVEVEDKSEDGDPVEDEAPVSFDKIIEHFRAKDLQFSQSKQEADAAQDAEPEEVATPTEIETDDKGLFEFNSGQYKIKIRSPRKRDMDVDC